jgi:hypothetical protein
MKKKIHEKFIYSLTLEEAKKLLGIDPSKLPIKYKIINGIRMYSAYQIMKYTNLYGDKLR